MGLPFGVARAAQLGVTVRPRGHALARAAAGDASPPAHVLPRVQRAPLLARPAALCHFHQTPQFNDATNPARSI